MRRPPRGNRGGSAPLDHLRNRAASGPSNPSFTSPCFAGPLPNGFLLVVRVRLQRSEEHTSELQSPCNLVCRLLLEKKKITNANPRAEAMAAVSAPIHATKPFAREDRARNWFNLHTSLAAIAASRPLAAFWPHDAPG